MIVVDGEVLEVETVGEEARGEADDPVVVQGQGGQGGQGSQHLPRQRRQQVLRQHEDVQVSEHSKKVFTYVLGKSKLYDNKFQISLYIVMYVFLGEMVFFAKNINDSNFFSYF